MDIFFRTGCFFVNNKKTASTEKYQLSVEVKARAIKAGETPQKSPILPPVHTFTKELVTRLNLMFS